MDAAQSAIKCAAHYSIRNSMRTALCLFLAAAAALAQSPMAAVSSSVVPMAPRKKTPDPLSWSLARKSRTCLTE